MWRCDLCDLPALCLLHTFDDVMSRVVLVSFVSEAKLLATRPRIYGVGDQTTPSLLHTFRDAMGRVLLVAPQRT